jgi:glycine cleavage system H protein
MPEYLDITVDKFTFKVARDRFYTRDGVWIMPSTSGTGSVVRLGLTDYLQQHSGDVAFVNLKRSGTKLSAGDEFAEIETIKVNVGLPSPIAGTITDINNALETNPEFANLDPYDKGWLVEIKPEDWEKAVRALLNAHAYLDFMKIEIDKELKET